MQTFEVNSKKKVDIVDPCNVCDIGETGNTKTKFVPCCLLFLPKNQFTLYRYSQQVADDSVFDPLRESTNSRSNSLHTTKIDAICLEFRKVDPRSHAWLIWYP